ncbi:hypothetical protein [Xanthomonas campestris]|uniref:hypothetical protein n=1 Tax=Xanthomonas campestris TaxID=339 RepID=UPI001EE88C73|nr:hypothetical protein [Xanthomonas campestris]
MTQNNDSSPDLIGAWPPVPQGLQEIFKDYPDYLARLQEALKKAVDNPSLITPPLEFSIWALEDCLDALLDEVDREIDLAQESGDQEEIMRAEEKRKKVSPSNFKHNWKSGNLLSYFNPAKE